MTRTPDPAPWRERRHYHYPCSKCGKPAETVRRRRARKLLCRKCRLEEERINPDQLTIC